MSFVINEEDYLAHYGRKGMKWYQHIFGDKYERQAKRAREKLRNQSFNISETLSKDKMMRSYKELNSTKIGRKYLEKSHKRSIQKVINQYAKLEKTTKKYLEIEKNPEAKRSAKLILDSVMKDMVDYEYLYRYGDDSMIRTRWKSTPKDKKSRANLQREMRRRVKSRK